MVLHVVVGAGAAGSMAAVALIEAGCDVLLIESGPARGWAHDPCPCFPADTRAGSGSAKMHACPLSWGDVAYSTTSNCAQQLETVTQPELLRRVVVYPQGRGIGGTLSVNAMIWSAGHRNVFDEQWPVGWGSADMDR